MVALPQGSYDQDAKPGEYERLPQGTYRAKIIEAVVEAVSDKEDKGRCLKLTWQVETGPLDGRLFWQRLNMWFSGAEKTPGKVAEIANQQFAAVREATVGLGRVVNDTDELLHIPCNVTYGPQKNNPDYDEVKSVKAIGGGQSVGQGGSTATSSQRSAPPVSNGNAAGGGSLPWKKTA